jgi:hypothetical protein
VLVSTPGKAQVRAYAQPTCLSQKQCRRCILRGLLCGRASKRTLDAGSSTGSAITVLLNVPEVLLLCAGLTFVLQAPLPVEQPEPTDTAADTIRQQDQQDQRTPQPQQQRPLAPWQADTLQQGQQSPATAAGRPQPIALQHTPKTRHIPSLLISPSARHIPSPALTPSGRHIPSPLPSPSARHIPSPLLSPSPAPSALRRSGHDSPMAALVRSSGSRIPTAPEAAAGLASLSYAAALRRSQTAEGRAAASAGGGGGVGAAAVAAGGGAAGISSKSSAEVVGGSKPPPFKVGVQQHWSG